MSSYELHLVTVKKGNEMSLPSVAQGALEDKAYEISEEISLMFNNVEKVGPEKQIHPADATGQSTYTGVYFWFKSKDYVGVECYDWTKTISGENKWEDNLRVSIGSKEFSDWLWQ